MLNKYSIKDLDLLKNVVKINLDENLNFDKILEYIQIIKSYNVECATYRCEWLDPIVLNVNEWDEINHIKEDLPSGKKVGNIQTYNYKKVPKVI